MDAVQRPLRDRAAGPPARLRARSPRPRARRTSRRWRRPPTSPSRTGRRWRTRVREAIASVLGRETATATRQVYDVAHNIAKLERHGGRRLCVHRKGATRAFPAGSDEIPAAYRARRPAGLHPRQHGHGELRPRRRARLDGALVRHDLPRRRPADAPHRRAQADRRRASCGASSRRRASSSAAPRTRGSPRRRRSPTRTSSGSSTSSSTPASRAASRGSAARRGQGLARRS